MNKTNEYWFLRNNLENLDVLEEVKDYLTLLGFKNHHVMMYNGIESLVVDRGVSSYLLVPNIEDMKLDMYKRDNLNPKRSTKWWYKRSFDGDDTYYIALKFIQGGKNI
ncbi:MAG: hypothetical protein ACRCTZ_21065 [Sarcina sp.]